MALTKIQRDRALARLRRLKTKKGVKTLPGVKASRGYELAYYREIVKPVDLITKVLKEDVLPLLEKNIENGQFENSPSDAIIKQSLKNFDKYVGSFDRMALKTASDFTDKNNEFHRRKFTREVNKTFGINITSVMSEKNVSKTLEKSIKRNTDLIVDLPEKYYKQIEKIVSTGLTSGKEYTSIRKQLEKIPGIHKRRAKLIAVDQTGKLLGELNKVRQENEGITKYQWDANLDARTRDRHVENDGEIFDWSDPSPGKATGRPGEEINCRCTANGVVDEEVLENLGAGDVKTDGPLKVRGKTIRGLEELKRIKTRKVTKGDNPLLSKNLRKVENEIAENGFETGIALDKNGKELFRIKGEGNLVEYNADQIKLLKDNILTHNHPGVVGGTFSPDDLAFFVKHGLKELRAVDRFNNYSITGRIDSVNALTIRPAMINASKRVKKIHAKWLNDEFKTRGDFPSLLEGGHYFEKLMSDEIRIISKKYGLTYKRSRRNVRN